MRHLRLSQIRNPEYQSKSAYYIAFALVSLILMTASYVKCIQLAAGIIQAWQYKKFFRLASAIVNAHDWASAPHDTAVAKNIIFTRDYQDSSSANSVVVTIMIGIGLILPIVIVSCLITTMALCGWPRLRRRRSSNNPDAEDNHDNDNDNDDGDGGPDNQGSDDRRDASADRHRILRPDSVHFFSAFLNGHFRNNRARESTSQQQQNNNDIELQNLSSRSAAATATGWPLPNAARAGNGSSGTGRRLSGAMRAESFQMPASPLPDPFLDAASASAAANTTRQNSATSLSFSRLDSNNDTRAPGTGLLPSALPDPGLTTPRRQSRWTTAKGKVKAQVDQIEMGGRVVTSNNSGISTPPTPSAVNSPYSAAGAIWNNGSFESGRRPLLPMPDLDVRRASSQRAESSRAESPVTSPESSFSGYTNTKRTEIRRDSPAFPAMNWAIGHERLAKQQASKSSDSASVKRGGADGEQERAGIKQSGSINTVANSSEWQTEYGTEYDD